MRRLRFVAQPSWLPLHAVTVAMVATSALLGWWQLGVSEEKVVNLQNVGCAVQWWVFGVVVVGMWVRLLRDAYRTREETAQLRTVRPRPVAYRRYVMPTMTKQTDDPVHTAYNHYLARIAAADLSPEDLW